MSEIPPPPRWVKKAGYYATDTWHESADWRTRAVKVGKWSPSVKRKRINLLAEAFVRRGAVFDLLDTPALVKVMLAALDESAQRGIVLLDEQIDQTANAVATLPTYQWGEWVTYLMEALDERARERGDSDVYTGVLDSVQRDIEARLESGRWQKT